MHVCTPFISGLQSTYYSMLLHVLNIDLLALYYHDTDQLNRTYWIHLYQRMKVLSYYHYCLILLMSVSTCISVSNMLWTSYHCFWSLGWSSTRNLVLHLIPWPLLTLFTLSACVILRPVIVSLSPTFRSLLCPYASILRSIIISGYHPL